MNVHSILLDAHTCTIIYRRVRFVNHYFTAAVTGCRLIFAVRLLSLSLHCRNGDNAYDIGSAAASGKVVDRRRDSLGHRP